jgi:hypothetical protein
MADGRDQVVMASEMAQKLRLFRIKTWRVGARIFFSDDGAY